MKVLLDMPVSSVLLDVLRAHGHEGVHAHQIGKDRASDRELLEIARREGRVIITADLDFPRLLALSEAEGPGVILFRGGSYSDREVPSVGTSFGRSAIESPGQFHLRCRSETHPHYSTAA